MTCFPSMLVPWDLPESVMTIMFSNLKIRDRDGNAITDPNVSNVIYQTILTFLVVRVDYVRGISCKNLETTRESERILADAKIQNPSARYSEGAAIFFCIISR